MCRLPQTIRIQQGYSQAFTNHDCRRPQEMGPRLTHPAVHSHNNHLFRGRSCKLSCNEKRLILLKSRLLIWMWSLVFYTLKPKVTEKKKSEYNSGFWARKEIYFRVLIWQQEEYLKGCRLGVSKEGSCFCPPVSSDNPNTSLWSTNRLHLLGPILSLWPNLFTTGRYGGGDICWFWVGKKEQKALLSTKACKKLYKLQNKRPRFE